MSKGRHLRYLKYLHNCYNTFGERAMPRPLIHQCFKIKGKPDHKLTHEPWPLRNFCEGGTMWVLGVFIWGLASYRMVTRHWHNDFLWWIGKHVCSLGESWDELGNVELAGVLLDPGVEEPGNHRVILRASKFKEYYWVVALSSSSSAETLPGYENCLSVSPSLPPLSWWFRSFSEKN